MKKQCLNDKDYLIKTNYIDMLKVISDERKIKQEIKFIGTNTALQIVKDRKL